MVYCLHIKFINIMQRANLKLRLNSNLNNLTYYKCYLKGLDALT
jgi:hypothetical protein